MLKKVNKFIKGNEITCCVVSFFLGIIVCKMMNNIEGLTPSPPPEQIPSESSPTESYPSELYSTESYPSESNPSESNPTESYPPEKYDNMKLLNGGNFNKYLNPTPQPLSLNCEADKQNINEILRKLSCEQITKLSNEFDKDFVNLP